MVLKTISRIQISFAIIRIPAELKDKLDNAAKENGKTLTAELILRLEMTFEQDDQVKDFLERVDRLENVIDGLEYDQRENDRRLNNLEGRY